MERQSDNDSGPVVEWLSDAGAQTWSVHSSAIAPLTFTGTISVQGEVFYALTFNAMNASIVPTLSAALVGSASALWSVELPELFVGLSPPLGAHLDLLPLHNILLVSTWQYNSSLAAFAAADAATGSVLWVQSSFFFAPTSALSFNWALTPDESTAFTAQLTDKGLDVSAWSIDVQSGNCTRLWRAHDEKATQEAPVGYVVLDTSNGVLLTSYSPSASPAILWALNASSGAPLWQLPLPVAIAGIALGPANALWLATADGYLCDDKHFFFFF